MSISSFFLSGAAFPLVKDVPASTVALVAFAVVARAAAAAAPVDRDDPEGVTLVAFEVA